MSSKVSIIAGVIFVSCLSAAVLAANGSAIQNPAALNPLGSATVPPSHYSSGLVRSSAPFSIGGNLVVSGNVGGGRHFRGVVPYNAISDFGSNLSTSTLYPFLRRSAGAGQFYSYGTQPVRFYSQTRTITRTSPYQPGVLRPPTSIIGQRIQRSTTLPALKSQQSLEQKDLFVPLKSLRPVSKTPQEMAESLAAQIDKLELDFKNPRLPQSMGTGKTENDIINFFLEYTSLIELMLAIKKNGFFSGEQLLVVANGEKYTVIEGNRRFSAVKLIYNPEIAKIYDKKVQLVNNESDYKPDKLPCLIFEDKSEILKYLGFRHITGIKSWRLLEKSRYVTKLRNDFYPETTIIEASKEVAKMIGSRMDYVRRLIVGYQLYEKIELNAFYGIKGWDDTNFHFNYLADSLSRSKIIEFLGVDFDSEDPVEELDYKRLQEWTNWFFNKDLSNKIIGDSEHLNQLNKILDPKYPLALEAFRSGAELKVAYEYTDGIKEQFEKAIDDSIKHLEKADSLSHKQTEFRDTLDDDLRNISGIIRKIKSVKDEIESDEKLGL